MAALTDPRSTLRHVVPGAGMIAVTFGLARYGYGLLLPDMRSELGLDPSVGGLIASGGYLGYLAGITITKDSDVPAEQRIADHLAVGSDIVAKDLAQEWLAGACQVHPILHP